MNLSRIQERIKYLGRRIKECEEEKSRIDEISNKLLSEHLHKKNFSYASYEKVLRKLLNGKTRAEGLNYYNSQIKSYQNEINKLKQEQRKLLKRRTLIAASVNLFIFALIIPFILNNSSNLSLTGFLVSEPSLLGANESLTVNVSSLESKQVVDENLSKELFNAIAENASDRITNSSQDEASTSTSYHRSSGRSEESQPETVSNDSSPLELSDNETIAVGNETLNVTTNATNLINHSPETISNLSITNATNLTNATFQNESSSEPTTPQNYTTEPMQNISDEIANLTNISEFQNLSQNLTENLTNITSNLSINISESINLSNLTINPINQTNFTNISSINQTFSDNVTNLLNQTDQTVAINQSIECNESLGNVSAANLTIKRIENITLFANSTKVLDLTQYFGEINFTYVLINFDSVNAYLLDNTLVASPFKTGNFRLKILANFENETYESNIFYVISINPINQSPTENYRNEDFNKTEQNISLQNLTLIHPLPLVTLTYPEAATLDLNSYFKSNSEVIFAYVYDSSKLLLKDKLGVLNISSKFNQNLNLTIKIWASDVSSSIQQNLSVYILQNDSLINLSLGNNTNGTFLSNLSENLTQNLSGTNETNLTLKQNNPPILMYNLTNLTITNTMPIKIKLSRLFYDPDSDELSFLAISDYPVVSFIDGDYLYLYAERQFDGIRELKLMASDGINITFANYFVNFSLNSNASLPEDLILEESLNQSTIENNSNQTIINLTSLSNQEEGLRYFVTVNGPTKWIKKVRIQNFENAWVYKTLSFLVPTGSKNITVSLNGQPLKQVDYLEIPKIKVLTIANEQNLKNTNLSTELNALPNEENLTYSLNSTNSTDSTQTSNFVLKNNSGSDESFLNETEQIKQLVSENNIDRTNNISNFLDNNLSQQSDGDLFSRAVNIITGFFGFDTSSTSSNSTQFGEKDAQAFPNNATSFNPSSDEISFDEKVSRDAEYSLEQSDLGTIILVKDYFDPKSVKEYEIEYYSAGVRLKETTEYSTNLTHYQKFNLINLDNVTYKDITLTFVEKPSKKISIVSNSLINYTYKTLSNETRINVFIQELKPYESVDISLYVLYDTFTYKLYSIMNDTWRFDLATEFNGTFEIKLLNSTGLNISNAICLDTKESLLNEEAIKIKSIKTEKENILNLENLSQTNKDIDSNDDINNSVNESNEQNFMNLINESSLDLSQDVEFETSECKNFAVYLTGPKVKNAKVLVSFLNSTKELHSVELTVLKPKISSITGFCDNCGEDKLFNVSVGCVKTNAAEGGWDFALQMNFNLSSNRLLAYEAELCVDTVYSTEAQNVYAVFLPANTTAYELYALQNIESLDDFLLDKPHLVIHINSSINEFNTNKVFCGVGYNIPLYDDFIVLLLGSDMRYSARPFACFILDSEDTSLTIKH